MCGIFGIVLAPGAEIAESSVREVLQRLYLLSESRGKESAGLHLYLSNSAEAWTLKGAHRATELLRSGEYRETLAAGFAAAFGDRKAEVAASLVLLAHSRLVTNGSAELIENNQPVRSGAVTLIHNGIIVNVDELWAKHSEIERRAEVDSEVLAALLESEMSRHADPAAATSSAYRAILGTASIAWVHDRSSLVTLATNTGDLYFLELPGNQGVVFGSERYIVAKAIEGLLEAPEKATIEWLTPGHGLIVDASGAASPRRLDLRSPGRTGLVEAKLHDRSTVHRDLEQGIAAPMVIAASQADESLLRYSEASMRAIRRCSRCILPETFPFIEFDGSGTCNYCRSYRRRYDQMDAIGSRQQFIKSLEKYLSSDGQPDVLVAFSGGRDSSYGLHLIKKEFGLTPVTFTYDWGMVTDLARRNIARICGQLGIQNILVSADLKAKRSNIRKNVSAWLQQPDLGMIPLFMAGDKHFFRVVNQLKRQTGIALDLWCANPLENTDFKSGLCGIRPDFGKHRLDYLSLAGKARLAAYYSSRFLRNPGYLNSSLMDTVGAFFAYYFEPRRDFYFIFDHFVWNEDEVNRVLLGEYDWETAPDSTSTWRIGDGTAPFYNYIYVTARGFSEFDTFRSNQIREGMLSREDALQLVLRENRPRVPSLRWYLQTLGLDFNSAINRINSLDTLGLHA